MDLGMLLILIGNVILEVVGGGKFGKEANRVPWKSADAALNWIGGLETISKVCTSKIQMK